jgi:hypothetical protein
MNMAAKKTAEAATTAAAPVATPTTALATASNDEASALAAAFDFDFESTGLEEVDAEDLRFAVKVWNMKGVIPGTDGDTYRVNQFFDTLTEKTQKSLKCVFVTLIKSNDYSYFDNAKNESVRVCTSYDRVTGTLRSDHPKLTQLKEGDTRACEACPDAQWVKVDGKNTKACASVYGVMCVELNDDLSPGSAFMMRFKKTALNPFKTHMQKHHIKRRKDTKTNQLADVPLFAYAVDITLKISENGNYAVPVIEKGELLPRDLLVQLADQAKAFREMSADVSRVAEKKESAHGIDGAIDTDGTSRAASQSDFADS